MITTPTRTKASSAHNLPISAPESKAHTDLLAGLRPGLRELAVAGVVLIAVDLFAGWTYLASYFGYFRIPVEGLGLSLQEIIAQGLRTVLLPLTVVIVSAVAPAQRLRQAAIAVGAYLLLLAVMALANHWAAPTAVLVQLAASIVAAGIVFGLRIGIGAKPVERLFLGAAGLLLLVSIPVATGTLDASQTAAIKTTTLRVVTNAPVLPNAVPAAGAYQYNNYVLLRENDSRYWLFRIGDRYAYSIAKSEVVSIRY